MKHKKNILMYSFCCFLISCLSSCTKQDELDKNQSSTLLNIAVSIASEEQPSSRSSINSFIAGSKIGLFITKGSLDNPYEGNSSNLLSEYSGTNWLTDPINLKPAMAAVFAYYPYNSSYMNGKLLPVESTSQTDYMFGRGLNLVNILNTSTNIEMQHAFSKIVFQIKKVNYVDRAIVKSISITGKDRYIYPISGVLNCEEGIIAPAKTNGTLTIQSSKVLTESNQIFEALSLPLPKQISSDDLVFDLVITIDGADKQFSVNVPSGTHWRNGNTYIYSLTLTGVSLELSSDVTINNWGNSSTGNGSII